MIHNQHIATWVLTSLLGLMMSLCSYGMWHKACHSTQVQTMEMVSLTEMDEMETENDEDEFANDENTYANIITSLTSMIISADILPTSTATAKIADNQRLGLVRRYNPKEQQYTITNNLNTINGACPRGHAPFLLCDNVVIPHEITMI